MSTLVQTKRGTVTFTPTLFIGVGKDGHFFTLRETEPRYIPGPGPMGNAVLNGVYQGSVVVGSFHHFNLSQDADEAFAKATLSAAKLGLRLSTTRESLAEELAEIKRATSEQLAERERIRVAEDAAWIERRALFDAQEEIERTDLLASGRMPYGREIGRHFAELEPSYLGWMVSKRTEFEEGSILRRTAERIAADFRDLLLPEPTNQDLLGEVKARIELCGTVVRDYQMEGDWGITHLVTIVTDSGACVLAKGGWTAPVGSKVRIKGTVTKHDEYKGQAQTVINRVKGV